MSTIIDFGFITRSTSGLLLIVGGMGTVEIK